MVPSHPLHLEVPPHLRRDFLRLYADPATHKHVRGIGGILEWWGIIVPPCKATAYRVIAEARAIKAASNPQRNAA